MVSFMLSFINTVSPDIVSDVTRHDTSISRLHRIRERFKQPPEAATWLDQPQNILHFLLLAVRKAQADELTRQAASLAFITLLSLIPLLTMFSVIGARTFNDSEQQEVLLELLSRVLPYSEESLLSTLETFLANAHTVSGFGFLVFLVTAIIAFSSIERTVNHVWNVPRQRPFRVRLLSFTLLLFWGPLVIGTTHSGLFFLGRIEAFRRFADSLPAQFLPFVVTVVGLTMLYWMVPYTKVRFTSALGGGFTAALLLEALRQGFGLYIKNFEAVPVVYGGLGLAFFFMISIHLSWWIILLGSEVAYCAQHSAVMLRERHRAATPEGSWLGIVALAVLTERFRQGEPITPRELLADRLQLPTAELPGVLEPLLSGGLIRETGGDTEGFLLAGDPYQVRLTEVFELYESSHWGLLEAQSDELAVRLEELRAKLADARDQRAGEATLADLLDTRSDAGSACRVAVEKASDRLSE